MASIKKYTDKHGDTRYSFQLYVGTNPQTGKPKKTSRRGFKTKKEATLAASRLELEASTGSLQQDNNILFETVYHEWYAEYVNTVRESTTVRVTKMFDNHILPAFGNKRIRTITLADVQRAVNGWFKEVKVNYKRWYNFANMVFKYALKQGYIISNPATLVTMPKRRDNWQRDPNKFWTKQQLIHFFSYIDPVEDAEKYTLFRVLAYTGIRRGECLALTWQDINFKQATLSVNKSIAQGTGGKQIIQPPKTNTGKRIIPLDDITLGHLKHWRHAQQRLYLMMGYNTMAPGQLIFANTKNGMKSLNTPGKWLHAIIDDKPDEFPRITIHKLRHTHATLLFEAGASIKEVQDRLGDADVDTVMNVYAHVSNEQRRNTTDKLTRFMES
ncbi:site-specific integrase [Levilactobacillus brevis]|uniref:site-specific integrase n=1 Tax=Levilactobacillus brevis TaxID=1580 RepID=UPI001C10FD38|nr:site-specific integrase [Levilactobacillus brevis]MBU5275207.1 site-specific integrase [Levilactobacillus brevis]